jgi:high affinity Mn2+ porin
MLMPTIANDINTRRDPVPDITAHCRQGRVKYGFGLNTEQELTQDLRAFGTLGWNDGANESFARRVSC